MDSLYNIKKVNPRHPQAKLIEDAALIIKKGGLVVFPTTSLYGIGCDAFNIKALEKLFKIKKRSLKNPVLVLIHDKKTLNILVKNIPDSADRIMDNFWPGGITIVFKAKSTLPSILTSGTGKIGVRLCKHPVSHALTRSFSGPITGTSANISGRPGCADISQLGHEISSSVDLILDSGTLKGGTGSTIIDVTGHMPVILRQGITKISDVY
ncbi:Sua5/YciO/YrdC/YwlC family protein [Desulfonema limicola]|uniref:L-threonylcarbamoyladenylate synthase n=1 Tax=Desulfonema limicola TaxID=45656 RepID=A0A975BCE1_9BACT|nr:L-threonylcarbamoyladenylate synthase [Desulfonema limicola]QTA82700.1 Sua5/YciO/YrdC/YwlC family protein [Desulfonema limicola]